MEEAALGLVEPKTGGKEYLVLGVGCELLAAVLVAVPELTNPDAALTNPGAAALVAAVTGECLNSTVSTMVLDGLVKPAEAWPVCRRGVDKLVTVVTEAGRGLAAD